MMDDLKNENEILSKITSEFNVEGKIQRKQRIWININKESLIDVCRFVNNLGFGHLSAISVTDWLKKGEYEITYHLWSYQDKILLTLKIRINREKPVIPSVSDIWYENAQIHEREMHEMFGVEFDGNDDLNPLFLEDWNGPPPFKKDFDWRKYVREEYYNKENERERIYYE